MFYQTLATDTLPNGHDTITCYTLTENTALPEKKKQCFDKIKYYVVHCSEQTCITKSSRGHFKTHCYIKCS